MQKLSLNEAQQEFINRNLIPLFDEYKNNSENLLAQTQEGYMILINLNSLKNGHNPYIVNLYNPYTIRNIKLWCKINNKPFELIDNQEYKGNNKKLKWQCLKEKCGEIFEASWDNVSHNHGCGYCKGQNLGLSNCLATKRPDLIKYLKNTEDAFKYTEKSHVDITLLCPDCGYEKTMIISTLSIQGFSCNKCSDGISYPEKFMFNVLEQLNLEFKAQLTKTTFKWCNNFKYDFYISLVNCIIETHGLQHYKEITRGRSLKDEQLNDKYKYQLALKNNISNYIIIDCRKSDLDFIKNNILQSELPKLLNFKEEDIDWLKCHEYACNSLVKIACDLWNSWVKNTQSIADKLNISRVTIIKYLKTGKELNWCDYNAKKESDKNLKLMHKNNQKQIILLNTKEIFNSIKEASGKYGTYTSNINDCCRSKKQSAGKHPITGEKMVWMYYKDWEEKQNELKLTK